MRTKLLLSLIIPILILSVIAWAQAPTPADWRQSDNMRQAAIPLCRVTRNQLRIIEARCDDQILGRLNHELMKAYVGGDAGEIAAAKEAAMPQLYALQQDLLRLDDYITSVTLGLNQYKPVVDTLVGDWTPPAP